MSIILNDAVLQIWKNKGMNPVKGEVVHCWPYHQTGLQDTNEPHAVLHLCFQVLTSTLLLQVDNCVDTKR